jgi:hypothetical protein
MAHLEQGHQTFLGKGSQPLLFTGSWTTLLKITVSGMLNCPNHVVMFVVYT